MEAYLGIDVGSVSTKAAVIDGENAVFGKIYLPTQGQPIAAVQSVEPGETSDPEFLEKLRDSATPLTLGDGETKTVDVKLTEQP
jgi:activator of 2-hydroxyglutaryl-CoA dehydratase